MCDKEWLNNLILKKETEENQIHVVIQSLTEVNKVFNWQVDLFLKKTSKGPNTIH